MVRVLSVVHVMGMIVFMFGLTILVPLGVSWVMDDGALAAFDESLVICLSGGFLLWWATRKHQRELSPRDGFLLVALIWILLPAIGTLPLYLQIEGLSFTNAFFEAVSGLTATGATVLSGLDKLPASINFWRVQLHWLGGLGIIVLAVAILPMLGVGGRQMFRAETPGPFKDTKLTPRMTQTAKAFWLIYTGLTVLCAMAYHFAGMDWFDAVVHAMSTISLGGFSSRDASIGHFDSPAIEIVGIVFMLIAGINFATHFLMITRRSLRPLIDDTEAHWFVAILAVSCLGIAVYLWANGVYAEFWTALRHGAFNTVSVATTLGFASTDYGQWPIFACLWMLYLCGFVTCAGSTGGGIKLVRMQIMVKQMTRETTLLLHPQANVPLKLAGRVVPNQVAFAVLAYMSFYGASIVVLMFAMTMTGLDLLTALSAVLACLNNTGPGLGIVGPASTYEPLSDVQTWLCSLAMLLGRLELLTLFVVLSPGFWRR